MARPAVFVSGVGGKTVRSRRVTEQWNRKRAVRERERMGDIERARERDGERNRNTKNERSGRRERRKRDSNFFLRSIRRLLFPTNDSVLFATQANDDACARDKRAR